MARVEPQVQIRTRSIEQSAVVNKWISNSEGQFGGDNIAGDNGVGEKKSKSLQGIGSEPVNGVNHTAEEVRIFSGFTNFSNRRPATYSGLKLAFPNNLSATIESHLPSESDQHSSESQNGVILSIAAIIKISSIDFPVLCFAINVCRQQNSLISEFALFRIDE